MDNLELQAKMEALLVVENVFDRYPLTKALEQEYKDSNFYKETRMRFADAYDLYMRQRGNILNAVRVLGAENLSNIMDNYDLEDKLNKLKPEDREFLNTLVDLEGVRSK